MEALCSRVQEVLTIDEATAHWEVSRDVLIRFVCAAPNSKDLAWDFVTPRTTNALEELFDMHEATPPWLTTEVYASMFCGGPSSPLGWECHVVRDFAIYVEHNKASASDGRLGVMASEADLVLEDVGLEIVRKREKSRPSARLRNIRSRLTTLTRKPPKFSRDLQVETLWDAVRVLVGSDQFYVVEDELFPTNRDVVSRLSRRADPNALLRVLTELMKRQPKRLRLAAMWKAEALLREHFTELSGLNCIPEKLAEHRADFLTFVNSLCVLHRIPPMSDHILRRRKKPASSTHYPDS